jgi:hypothetical protein
MALRSFHLTRKGGQWSLEQAGSDTPVKTFKRKADATRGGVLEKALGPQGGTVKIHKGNGRIQEERTYPRGGDPKRSRG